VTTGRPAQAALPGPGVALLRWKLGHHLFHLQLAAMNTLLGSARESVESASWYQLAETFDCLSVLYDGATATMRYAADFPPELYQRLIRPSMAPPFTSPGFSGTLNLEHQLMLDQLRELRRQFTAIGLSDTPPRAARNAAARLWGAQARNRSHHKLICQRFVPDGRSMLRAFFREQRLAEAAQGDPPGQMPDTGNGGDTRMIHVVETWRIKEEFADRVPELMQEMDDLVGPRTHAHAGFTGHATFFRHEAKPTMVWILYPWHSHDSHEELISAEAPILGEFQAKYCAAPREIGYLSEIPHDHPGHE
jgi:hypothetical protein